MVRTAVVYTRPPDRYPPSPSSIPRGVELAEVFAEERRADRRRLSEALGSIAARRADTLLLLRLRAAAASLGELVRLLDWLEHADATLLALDVELDTATAAGRLSAKLLREVDGWGREPHPDRPPRGRPGFATGSPDLAERIGEMRARGLSMHAIAAALNAEQIPTPRGGAKWRASSVQAALGYRRPRPPHPGAPPPPGPPPPEKRAKPAPRPPAPHQRPKPPPA